MTMDLLDFKVPNTLSRFSKNQVKYKYNKKLISRIRIWSSLAKIRKIY